MGVAEQNGWLEWNGGDCPLDADAVLDIKMRDGETELNQRAGWYYWVHNNDDGDIVSYRPSPPKPT
jgi:hypothetical protein